MPPKQQTRARHAAPKEPVNRTVMLPAVLLIAAGSAFAGLAVVPAAADQAPVERVIAASAFTPVDVPAPGVELPTTADLVTGRDDAAKQAAAAKAAEQAAAAAAAKAVEDAAAAATADRASRSSRGDSADGTYARPGEGRLTSGFGRRWGRLHAGIDLAAGTGSPIRAAAAGKVTSAGRENGYGYVVRVRHADGSETVYAHNSRLLVSAGSTVAAGEQIAKEGNSGRSTGPHLHFEVRVNGSPINPITWLRGKGVSI